MTDKKLYRCIVTAINSPKNKCFCNEGEKIVPAIFLGKKSLKFIGVESRLTSKYAWVKCLDNEFIADDFKTILGINAQLNNAEYGYTIKNFLDEINRYPDSTPMALSVRKKLDNNMKKIKEYHVHKVIFYKA